MKLGGQIDFHGSRAYAVDLPTSAERNWARRNAARLTAWAKRKVESLLRPGAEQAAETMWLVRGDERHFSLLGAEYDRKPRGAPATRSLPEGEARVRRPIGYRTHGE